MSADDYAWPDVFGRLTAAEAKLAAVQQLIDTHTKKDGRVPVCQLRKAIA